MKKIFCITVSCVIATARVFSQQCDPDPQKREEEHTASRPNNFICHISVKRNSGVFNATASFVSGNVIVAAGHSFREKTFSHIKSVTLFVGQRNEQGQNVTLFTKTYKRSSLKIFVPRKFQHGSDPGSDYSYVALPEKISNDSFMLNTFSAVKNTVDSIYISGYPGDKGNTALWKKGEKAASVSETEDVLIYPMYTFNADSGAPVWCNINGNHFLLAIHGTGNYHNGTCNAGAKLTTERINELKAFMDNNRP